MTIGLKHATMNLSNIIILYRRLCNVAETSIVDNQLCIVIIFNGVNAAAECTTVDRQRRLKLSHSFLITFPFICTLRIVEITVINQAGKVAIGCHFYAFVNDHYTMVQDIIVTVTIRVSRRCTGFRTTSIPTTVQKHLTIIVNSCLLMGHIVHGTATLNNQRSALFHFNGVFTDICNLLPVQIQCDLFAGRNCDILVSFRNKCNDLLCALRINRLSQFRILLVANFGNRRICGPADAAQAQRHDQGQNGC